MKFDEIKNPNYVATIVRVPALIDLEGLDNLKALRVFGMQALVDYTVGVDTLGVLFSTEVQLSEEFTRANNLYRHENLNADPTKKGYLEDSRRVKSIRLRGHRSDSLFLPLTAFLYLGIDVTEFRAGDTFDSINGHEILRKYVIREPGVNKGPVGRVRRVDLKVFPLHIDSENYWRNADKIPTSAPIVVTQKLHGTSVRYGHVPVLREKRWLERLLNKFGFQTSDNEYKFVVGSRKVLKSIDYKVEGEKINYYATDLWTEYAHDNNLHEVIPPGYLVYGEIVGRTKDGAAIQKNYEYTHIDEGMSLYVYRVATVTPTGVVTDLSWPATKAFCGGAGMKWVPELWAPLHADFDPDWWIDKCFYDDWVMGASDQFIDQPVPLSDPDTVDEGVCVRYDGPNGIYILKAKSPIFLGHESALLDVGADDLESGES